jgi:hypothetical protein
MIECEREVRPVLGRIKNPGRLMVAGVLRFLAQMWLQDQRLNTLYENKNN